MDRASLFGMIEERYTGCYDIVRTDNSDGLIATCEYHEHDVGYALSRKAEMWSADRHEYVWFYSIPLLTAELYDEYYQQAFKEGMERVDPKEGHMSSAVVVVFIADTAEAEALEKVKRAKYRKDFKFGLNGWVVVRTACVTLEPEQVITNGEGRAERKFLDSLLNPQMRKKRRIGAFSDLIKKVLD